MIIEQLRNGCFRMSTSTKLDIPQGRVMSDVTSMFILYFLELYKWSNNLDLTKQYWPYIKRAAQWHINVSSEVGVPQHLVNTYDILAQNHYNLCAYNSAFHLLAMVACRELATAMGDTKLAQQCQGSYLKGQDAMDKLQWNETAGYYNSYTNLNHDTNTSSDGYPENVYIKGQEVMEGLNLNRVPYTPGAIMTDTFYSQVIYIHSLAT